MFEDDDVTGHNGFNDNETVEDDTEGHGPGVVLQDNEAVEDDTEAHGISMQDNETVAEDTEGHGG